MWGHVQVGHCKISRQINAVTDGETGKVPTWVKFTASTVADDLELRGIQCVREGYASPHGTPGPGPSPQQAGSANGGDAEGG